MSLRQIYKNVNGHVATCCASGRSCPRNDSVRNVFRAPFPHRFFFPNCMFKIYSNSYGLGHTCPSGYTVRSVWRAPPFDSVEPLGRACGRPVRQGRPRTPEKVRWETIWPAKVPHGCPPDLTSVCLRLHPDLRFAISSVGGSAMHMERPDDVGREAGIGRTRSGEELTIFRACP